MAPSVAIAEVEKSIAKLLSRGGEESNESATETPSIVMVGVPIARAAWALTKEVRRANEKFF